jgi:putative heme transporter
MRQWLPRGLLIAALGIAAYRVSGELGGALRTIATADATRLALAAAFEVVSYLFIGSVLRRLAHDRRVSLAHAFRVGLVAVGLGNILPAAPVEGMMMGARELEGRGLARRRTFVAVGLVQWYCARALFAVAALTAIGVAAFAALRASPFNDSWPALLGGGAVLAMLFVVMGTVASRARLHERIGRLALRVPLCRARAEHVATWCNAWSGEMRDAIGSRRDRARLIALAIGASVAEAACFVFALRAAGVDAHPGVLLLAYVVGMLGMFVPLLPAGIGFVETAVPALLQHAHVPIAAALAGVLAYRALATLLPAFVGAGALGHFRLSRWRG